jgi:hypothetical protein
MPQIGWRVTTSRKLSKKLLFVIGFSKSARRMPAKNAEHSTSLQYLRMNYRQISLIGEEMSGGISLKTKLSKQLMIIFH